MLILIMSGNEYYAIYEFFRQLLNIKSNWKEI